MTSLLVMQRAHALWEQIWCQDKCFLIPEDGFLGQDRIRKEQLSIMHLLASFSSSVCVSWLLDYLKNFSGKLFFPGSFINKHFNVGCFHSLCSSILCRYSFCLCQPLKYLITNKSATVNFLLEKQQSSWERLLRAVLYRVDIMSS